MKFFHRFEHFPFWNIRKLFRIGKPGRSFTRVTASFDIRIFRRAACFALLVILASITVANAATLPTGFTESQWGSNIGTDVTAMEFAPDGRLFVCEQGGALRVITAAGTLLPTPFVTVTTSPDNERGLLGVTFDPNFATNQFVYVYYTFATPSIHNRVSRFTANGNVAVPNSETVIVDLDNTTNDYHNGGAIHFGPDGKLYIAVGENGTAANAQSVSNRLGKLLRINSDGTIPLDNPTTFPGIVGSPTGANLAIWAVGFRNPYTFSFQSGTGRLFVNDVGESSWEEINDGIAGSNYGWSLCEGFCSPQNPNYRDPLFEYGHGGGSTTGCAIVGGAFYNPTVLQFPNSYLGRYFFGDLCSGWIRLFDPSNNSASSFASSISTLVDLKVGPEGYLYYLARGNGGQVWRIRSTQPTPTPAPTATPSPTPTPTAIPSPTPSPVPTASPTPTPLPISISGSMTYCTRPVPGPVPNVILTLTGSSSGTTISDGAGNYVIASLLSGGNYTVTPAKPNLVPAAAGINTVDVLGVQRHFLNITFLTGCALAAADANGDASITTIDVIGIQRFYLGFGAGTANVGIYQFTPSSRNYPGVTTSQSSQNFSTIVFGDVASPFVE